MTALRWTRRLLSALLLVAALAVLVTAALQLLAPIAGGRALVIGGGSMEPAIGRGALVLALPSDPDEYRVGEVVAVQQGAATPFTHRITRLADLRGVPHVETRGDANAGPDPAIVPTAAVIGRIVVSIPLLGYLAIVLASGAGLAGFLAVCAAALIFVWVVEDLEGQRCPACAVDADGSGAATSAPLRGSDPTAAAAFAGPGSLGAFPAFAAPRARARVRETGRARGTTTPVLLERDRRNPHRHGIATSPVPAAGGAESAPGADAAHDADPRGVVA
ncbi:MAG TPA: signal peptidase I [Patescibacteria group bacterium]|nr:signal peptidase I [Patescibacteria group bacterium]